MFNGGHVPQTRKNAENVLLIKVKAQVRELKGKMDAKENENELLRRNLRNTKLEETEI